MASFNSEMQNDPIDPENADFNEEWLDYYEPELMDFKKPNFVIIGANDPSLGKNKKADTSSIIDVALDLNTGYMYVLGASVERRKPDAIIDDVIETHRRYKRDLNKGYYRFRRGNGAVPVFLQRCDGCKGTGSGRVYPHRRDPVHCEQRNADPQPAAIRKKISGLNLNGNRRN